jgi:hypothetical protein
VRTTLLRLLAAMSLLAALLVATLATPASAGDGNELFSEPTGNRAEPEFTFEPEGEPSCTGSSVTIEGDEGELDAEDVLTFDTPLSGTFHPGDAPAGFYELTIFCPNGEFPETWVATFAFARLTVNKVVEGTAPAGTTFEIEVDCVAGLDGIAAGIDFGSFVEDLEYGAFGGVQDVILYSGAVCTTTETDDGGADSSSVEGAEADFEESPIDLTATVTNVFAAETVAAPAEAAPVAPTFTG